MSDEKAYPTEYADDSSHAHAVELLRRGPTSSGLVVDIGCGNAPVAVPLTDLGFEYVGLDVDKSALAGLAKRGIESHKVDLGVSPPRLLSRLRDIVAGRPLAAVFALDVLEHVVDPAAIVSVLAELAEGHPQASLIVSIPNVSHVDVGTRLLLGRWDMTPMGLLDDTHLRFFSPRGFDLLFVDTPWREVDAHDTIAPFSDQYLLQRSPALQPGGGIGNLLRRIRGDAEPHATTYQFVRRFTLAPSAPQDAVSADEHDGQGGHDGHDGPFVTIVVSTDDAESVALLRADLAAQTDPDYELVLAPAASAEARNDAIDRARGDYLVFLESNHRVGPRLVECIRRGAGQRDDPVSTDCVVRLDVTAAAPDLLARERSSSFDDLAGARPPIELDGFDPLRADAEGTTVLAAYAIPASACRTLGLRFDGQAGSAASTVFVARAVELCTQFGIGDLQIVVDEASVRPASVDLPALREALGSQSYVLPPGGLARAYIQRQTFGEVFVNERELRVEVDELRRTVDRVEQERDIAQAELDSVLGSRTWRYAQMPRRVYLWVRAVIGRR